LAKKKTNVAFDGCEVLLELLAFYFLAFQDVKLFFILLCGEIPTNPLGMIFSPQASQEMAC
jgi:hypothetical protein